MRNFLKKTIILILLLTTKNLFAHMYEHMGIEILHPWATSSDSDGNSIAYLTISNNTNSEVVLEKFITDVSDMTMFMSDNKMVKSLKIPANSIRSIDDFSIMLHGIKSKLIEGKAFKANLVFLSGMNINIKLVVGENTSLDDAEKTMDHEHKH